MRSNDRVLLCVALLGVLGLVAADALGAGCAADSKEKRAMQKMMSCAGNLASEGKSLEAFKQYKEAAGMGACPILKKKCEKDAQGLLNAAKKKLDAADVMAKQKEVEQEDATEMYCDIFKMQIAWPRHFVASEARKRLKKLKRKIGKDTKKEAEKEAKQILKDASAFLKENNLRSALAAYERLFDQYAFTKKAGSSKTQGLYLRLQKAVEEENRREEEARKAKR